MSRLQALRDALRPLGIYKLEKGTLVYAELAAYAAGLDLLEDGLDELEREAFLPTAQGEGISRREEIYGKPKTLLPLRERREMLLYRGAINNRNNTREDLERALVACGLRAQVKENLDGASIYICLLYTSPAFWKVWIHRFHSYQHLQFHLFPVRQKGDR